MWRQLEEIHPAFRRDDPATWDQAPLTRFGMPRADPVLRAPILALRQLPALRACFASVLLPDSNDGDNNADDDIVCSHDRWLLHRRSSQLMRLSMPHLRFMIFLRSLPRLLPRKLKQVFVVLF